MTTENKELTFTQKINKIQTELKAPKSQKNAFGKYNYRSCEDILEAVKSHLAQHELILTVQDEIVEIGGRIYVKATTNIRDDYNNNISTVAFAREPENKKGMDESQITGATSSYARKYALNGLFCIDDTKDADTQDNSVVGACINEKQFQELTNLIEKSKTDIKKLCAYCKINAIKNLPSNKFQDIKLLLENKIK